MPSPRTALRLFVDLSPTRQNYVLMQMKKFIIVLSTLNYFSLSGNDSKHTTLIFFTTAEQTGLIGNLIL